MFTTLLRRELTGHLKQTIIITVGMALAITLVIVVNSFAAGVRDAQATALESIYGVGTDITVTEAAAAPGEGGEGGGPGQFDFGSDEGTTEDGTTSLSQTQLSTGMGTTTFDASALGTVQSISGVAAAAATLSLTNTSFSGELPDMSQSEDGSAGDQGQPPQGGADGAGGSSFNIDSFSVLGLDPSSDAIGPLSAVELTDGRGLEASDVGENVAVIDADYATSAELAVGDTLDVGGTEMTVVGIVSSTSTDSSSASDVYIPLDVAQSISGETDMVSTIYVQAESANDIASVKTAIEEALPDTTVNTQEDLASSVTGSLSTASGLVSTLGFWLSIIVLAAAILLAALFTISGVTRRTREFGTLKAIGWSNGRVVRQVAGESFTQATLGGLVGAVIGIIAVAVINMVGITLTAGATSTATDMGAGGPGGGAGGGFGGGAPGADTATQTASDIVLSAPINWSIVVVAIVLAAAGGLVAGAFGGWRAARLRPAEALRSIA